MLKKLMYLMAASVMLFATSCENDADVAPNAGEAAVVTFSVGTPEIVSRAYSDGTTATKLQYAVYNEDGEILNDLTKTDATINGSTNVKLQLTTGNSYSVIFWAAAPNAPYTVDFANKTMTVDYNGAICNDENRDAFYKYHKFTVNGTQTETIELKRPFAQLNIGTSDYAASASAGYVPTQSWVKVPVYNTLNFTDGTVGGQAPQTFYLADIKKDETFPVAGNEYIAMNYLLVAADKELVDVEFAYTDGTNAKSRKVGSVPVQRNYRTNIFGKLLTSDVDINVEINPDYEEPDYNIYNVAVNGETYTDFAAAIEEAMKLNKPIEFVENVTIDADNTITIPEGNTLTLNLNGYTLTGVTDDADKNDDGRITTADNEVMFDVRGTMNVDGANTLTRAAAEGNGAIVIKHINDYANFDWNASGEIFYVGFNGTLNVENATLKNEGGIPMAYAIDMVNAAKDNGITVNVENSTIISSYIPVRVFNNGAGMNNVTIANSTLESKGGKMAFWVHNYSSQDNGGKGVKDATLNLNIFNPTQNNTFIPNEKPIGYGFNDRIYFDENGNQIYDSTPIVDENGNDIDGVVILSETTDENGNKKFIYGVTNANGLAWIANKVDNEGVAPGNDDTEAPKYIVNGQTVMLLTDIDLSAANWAPIGDNRTDVAFTGILDGQNHTIAGIHITGDHCFNGAVYGSKEGWGLFSVLDGATVKNLKVDGATFGSYTVVTGVIAGYADDTTFENIDITNSKVAGYNWNTGGVVGWATGECTFKNINLDETVAVGSLWDSYGQNAGGIAGAVSASAKITIEDCNIACVIDVINDVTSNYKWCVYRVAGMIIGNTNTTETKYNEVVTATATNVTCKNVTVTYGKWMNYHYCEGFWNRGWGRYESSDYIGGVDEDEPHNHAEGEEHLATFPFDQLFGGSSNGTGHYPVRGLAEFPGVTVVYPAEYTCPTCGQQHNVAVSNE